MTNVPRSDESGSRADSVAVDWEDEPGQADLQKVRELFVGLSKAVRAHQLYDENNPVHQRFVSGLRERFTELWERIDRLSIQVDEERFVWMGEEVYRSDSRSDSLAFLFYKDGVREIAFEPGIESDELTRLLDVIHRARNLRPETDDLLTILWDENLQTFDYEHVDVLAEGVQLPVPGEGVDRDQLQQVVREETDGGEPAADEPPDSAGEPPPGPVSTEDFNPTLYSLDPKERDRLREEVEAEMDRDLRRAVLTALFDRLEEPAYRDRQSEILDIFETLLPNLLSRGALRAAAAILHEVNQLLGVDGILDEERREEARALLEKASRPETVRELVRALDDGSIPRDARSLSAFLRFLRPEALPPLLVAAETVEDPKLKDIVSRAVRSLGEEHRATLVELFEADDARVVAGAIRLAGAIGLEGAAPRLRDLLEHEASEVRLAAVEAAVELRASVAASAIEVALEDPDRDVRIAAARALGSLRYGPAAPRFRKILKGKAIRRADVSEMIAFFESYGELGDPEAVPLLDGLLNGKSFFGRRESEDIRAGAALALGRVGTPEARRALQGAREQEEPVVRSAVSRALKGGEGDAGD